MAHAWLINFDLIGAGADACRRIIHAAIGLNDQVVVRHQIGKVSVAAGQVHDQRIAVGGHAFDAAHDAQCAGLRIFAGMALHGLQRIFGCHSLAVVELNALAHLEAP